MTTCLFVPAPPGARRGNRVTALRWARVLRQLGERVVLLDEYRDGPWDRLLALHARKSAAVVERFHRERPRAPILVAMTGTDLYEDLPDSIDARRSLALATRIVLLQPLGIEALPVEVRGKARTILQSAGAPGGPADTPATDAFEVCVIGNLRAVKDPLRSAEAARLARPASRLRVLHVGAVLDEELAARARREQAENPRYRWLGERPRLETLRLLARCRLLVLTSRLEGGANVISEAVACGVPVVSSRIAGSLGLLGPDHPGYFPVGDTAALAALLARCEEDPPFLDELRRRSERLRPLFDPTRERDAWRALLAELS